MYRRPRMKERTPLFLSLPPQLCKVYYYCYCITQIKSKNWKLLEDQETLLLILFILKLCLIMYC